MDPKPTCKLFDRDATAPSLPFRVRDALLAAGRETQVVEFLQRAERCQSWDEFVELAQDYVTFA